MSTLQHEIATFMAAHDMPPATFGRLAVKDPRFVFDLDRGRRVWPETEAKVRTFMAEYASPSSEAA
jgi:hypothetical protein